LMEWRCNHQAFGRDVQPAITNSPTHLLTVISCRVIHPFVVKHNGMKAGYGKHCETNRQKKNCGV
jgi:hypothetical protein